MWASIVGTIIVLTLFISGATAAMVYMVHQRLEPLEKDYKLRLDDREREWKKAVIGQEVEQHVEAIKEEVAAAQETAE